MDYRSRYDAWLKDKALDEQTRQELIRITDEAELTDRFYKDLEFGTAGLRGILGAGSNRMNVYTVGRAAQGLANYLKTIPNASEAGVAIAYDSRKRSDEFALRSALILAANGIRAYLFSGIRAVPQLSFAVGYLKCAAGIVITPATTPRTTTASRCTAPTARKSTPRPRKASRNRLRAFQTFPPSA